MLGVSDVEALSDGDKLDELSVGWGRFVEDMFLKL